MCTSFCLFTKVKQYTSWYKKAKKVIIEANNNFINLKEKYKELKNNKEIITISKRIEELDEAIIVNRDYYNKNIAEYNKLVAIFPTNIVARICKYKEKLYYDKKDMTDDDFNDFKL